MLKLHMHTPSKSETVYGICFTEKAMLKLAACIS
jgi:hypothetical protein